MAVSVAVLETLEEAHFPPAQVRALARVFELEFRVWRDDLVTQSGLRAELAIFRHEMTAALSVLDSRIGAVEKRLDGIDQRLDGIDRRLDGVDQRLDGVENRLSEVESRLGGLEARLCEKIAEAKVDNMRWTMLVMTGQTTLLAGVMYFLLQYLR